MTTACDQALEHIDWDRLCQLQVQLIQLVRQLSCAALLLAREYQSAVHLAQLGRDKMVVEWAMGEWKELVDKLQVKRAVSDHKSMAKKLEEWMQNLKKKLPPHEKEVKEFLWLM